MTFYFCQICLSWKKPDSSNTASMVRLCVEGCSVYPTTQWDRTHPQPPTPKGKIRTRLVSGYYTHSLTSSNQRTTALKVVVSTSLHWRWWSVHLCIEGGGQYIFALKVVVSTSLHWRWWSVHLCIEGGGQYIFALKVVVSTPLHWRWWSVHLCIEGGGQYTFALKVVVSTSLHWRWGSVHLCMGDFLSLLWSHVHVVYRGHIVLTLGTIDVIKSWQKLRKLVLVLPSGQYAWHICVWKLVC